MRSKNYVLPVKSRRKSATINVNTAEPIIAQTTGNGLPSILIVKNSGKAKRPAIYKPIYAPINPTTMETRHPPKS